MLSCLIYAQEEYTQQKSVPVWKGNFIRYKKFKMTRKTCESDHFTLLRISQWLPIPLSLKLTLLQVPSGHSGSAFHLLMDLIPGLFPANGSPALASFLLPKHANHGPATGPLHLLFSCLKCPSSWYPMTIFLTSVYEDTREPQSLLTLMPTSLEILERRRLILTENIMICLITIQTDFQNGFLGQT